MEKVEVLILRNLLYNEEYLRKVIPFIKPDYFEDLHQKVVFEEILKFVNEYNTVATKEVLCIEVENRQDINDSSFKEIAKLTDQSLSVLQSQSSFLLSRRDIRASPPGKFHNRPSRQFSSGRSHGSEDRALAANQTNSRETASALRPPILNR